MRATLTSATVAVLAAAGVGLAPSPAGAAGPDATGTIVTSEEARQAPLTKAQMRNAVKPKEARSGAKSAAALNCSYTYVCGQGGNGNRFDYTVCDTVYTLPNLVGWGPVNNNQTPGTWAHFYDEDGYWMFSINAPVQGEVNWTPVWYAIAC
ncbi:hypothetical protein ACFYXC_20960 [Streptomyces sp. NPDC002701]|uniref:hypothetical protein n=1 Tax=unclassified Streptomyces TaxID=2593676 RepID=UPI00367BDFE9